MDALIDLRLTPQPVLNHSCVSGEGPVWDAENKNIFWIDIVRKEIHQYNILTGSHKIIKLEQMPGAVALRKKGGLVAALENGFAFVDPDKGFIESIFNPEKDLPNRFNDGKCDGAGRFWAGTMSLSEEENKGNLYVMETDMSVKTKIENVTISNGIAWSPDNAVMYYINSPTNYVFAFDFNMEDGSIANQRIAVDLTHENGYADGMTIDNEGKLWIAFYGGWRVSRYDPDSGKLLKQINLPVANVTSCTFGGIHLQDLYITTAKKGLSEEDLKQQLLAGCLFAVKDCGFKGLETFMFEG